MSDIDSFISSVAIARNHSAFIKNTFPRTYTTTYPRAFAHRPTREHMDSELTSFLPAVLTGWIPSLSIPSALRSLSLPFQLRILHDPFGFLATPLASVIIKLSLLAGIALCTSLGVRGGRRTRTADNCCSQASLGLYQLSYSPESILIYLLPHGFKKPANFTAGWDKDILIELYYRSSMSLSDTIR